MISCTPAVRSITTGSGPFGVATSDNMDMSEIPQAVSDLQRPWWSLEAEKHPPSDVNLHLAIAPGGRWVNTGQQPEACAGTCDNQQCAVP